MKDTVKNLFYKEFGYNPDKLYFSPGRVNIIGGHTDYNGGAVLPFCIDLGIYAAVSKRKDKIIKVYSTNMSKKGIINFNLNNLDYDKNRNYVNYVSGVLHKLKSLGYIIHYGFDMVISGNLPRGGGLSSSAALLVLTTKIIKDLMNLDITDIEIAKITKAVENQYIGVQCGIMDQFIIAKGKKDNVIYLESSTLDFEYIPCELNNYKFVLINSNVARKLTNSEYNTRQAETQEVLKILRKHVNINHICDLSPKDYNIYEQYIESHDLKKRFKHLVNEHLRVKQARDALQNSDFESLGKLLYAAHISAKNLYQVSSNILDELVEMGMDSGSLGSKMIGGGFGGSTLNLIKSDNMESFLTDFTIKYKNRFRRTPIINIVNIVDGVRELL